VQLHRKLNTRWPKRIAAYRKQLRVVVDAAQRHSAAGPVAVMGDFNFDGDPDGGSIVRAST
jgi:endonuclease/exonuclease/phosphatase (EEP) superfamily protein YafD